MPCDFPSESLRPKPNPCQLTDQEFAGLNVDARSDVHAINLYGKVAYHLLESERLDSLDCIANTARADKERFSGGMWKIHAFYNGLWKPPLHATQEDWEKHLKLLQDWVSAKPDSVTARIAPAQSYVAYGEDARGAGFSDTVSESGWRLLADRVAKAKQILDEAASLPTKDPEWYVVMQNVALHQGWDRDAARGLLDKATRFEPSYYYYYRLYANSILPKWGGEEGEVLAEF